MRLLPPLLLLASCARPGRVDLELRAPDGISLDDAETLEVVLFGSPDDEELAHGEARGRDLAELATVLEATDMDPGNAYVLQVEGELEACASGRVVGRSLPFEIPSDDWVGSVTTYVACADAPARTEGRLAVEQFAYASVWHPELGAVLAGGGSTAHADLTGTLDELETADTVQRYDLATGEFVQDAPLLTPRAYAGAALLDDGRIVVMGGAGDPQGAETVHAMNSVEALDGAIRSGLLNLTNQWLETTLVRMSDATLAVVGIGYSGTTIAQAEVYDAAAGRNVASAPALVNRLSSTVTPFHGRDRALIVGGLACDRTEVDCATPDLQPRSQLFCATAPCACGEPPCFSFVDAEQDLPRAWTSAAGAYVTCPDGGGAAYVMGGDALEGASRPDVSSIFCFRDDPAEPDAALVKVGDLAHARRGFSVVPVRGSRLLVVGGSTTADGPVPRPVDEVELVPVDGCSCAPIVGDEIKVVPLDLEGHYLGSNSATPLGDGTVLVAGSATTTFGADGVSITPTQDAWVFNPEF